ncbi:MAG: hypothetical protein HYS13_00235, partial [Planctomycetia bacterium]|nr:hypothetical protein [Planctomycetia bacterium]
MATQATGESTSSASESSGEPKPLPKRRPLAWWVYVAMFLLVVAMAIGGFYGAWYLRARAELQKEIAGLRERGEPVWFAEIAPPPVNAADNAAPLLLQAVKKLAPPNRALYQAFYDALARANEVARYGDEKGSRTAIEEPALVAGLEANGEALAVLRQALQKPRCVFPIDYQTHQPFAILLEHIQQSRELARLLQAEFHLALAKGDVEGALRAIDDGFALSECLREEPFLVSQLVRIVVARLAVDELAILAGRIELSDAQRDRFDERLAAMAASFRLRPCVVAERAGVLTTTEHLSDNDAAFVGTNVDHYPGGMLRPMVMQEQAFMIRFLSKQAEAVDATGPAGKAMQQAIEQEIQDASVRYMLSKMLMPAVGSVRDAGIRHRQSLQNARAGLRIDRYFRQNGKLPQDLSGLTDERLTETPKCLYSDLPLILRVEQAEGFSLYGPGDNGSDDGGERTPDAQEGLSAFRVIYKPP